MLHSNIPLTMRALPTDNPPQDSPTASHLPETARGMLARERMLRTAVDQFGRHGFDGTTTRTIAAAAGMNLGAIAYYFGTKEDLYVAAAGFLADAIQTRQERHLQIMQTARPAHGAPSAQSDALIDQLVTFLCQQARLLLADDIPASWVQFFLRLQAQEGPAFDRLFNQVVAPMQDAVEGLVARICEREATDALPRALTFLAAHQVMSLRLSDAQLMRRLGWDQLTPERTDQLLDLIAITLRAQFAALAPQP